MANRVQTLGEVAAVIFAGMPTKADGAMATGPAGNLLTVRALNGTGIDRQQLQFLNSGDRGVEKFRVQSGDLLISARSTSLKTAIVSDDLNGSLINATLIGVRCLPTLLPRLLVAWLNGADGRASLEAVSQSGTHQMNITVSGLNRLPVPVPSLETQHQLVQLLFAADDAYHSAVQAADDRYRLANQIIATQLMQHRND